MAGYTLRNWRKFALCAIRGIAPDLFFVADTNAPLRNRLRRICGACEVRQFCLEENLLVSDGMFGGFTRRERIRIAIKRGIPYELLPSSAKEYVVKKKSAERMRIQNA